MRQKQDQDKRDLVESQRSMSSIAAAARRQYEAEQKAAEDLAASNMQSCMHVALRFTDQSGQHLSVWHK